MTAAAQPNDVFGTCTMCDYCFPVDTLRGLQHVSNGKLVTTDVCPRCPACVSDAGWLYQWVDDVECPDGFLDDVRDICAYPVPDPDAPQLERYCHRRWEFLDDVRDYLSDLQHQARCYPQRFARKLWRDVNAWSTDNAGALPDGFTLSDVERLTRILTCAQMED